MGIVFHLSPQSRPEPRSAAHGRPSRRRGMVPFCRRRWGRPRTWKREWRSRLRGLEFDLFVTEKIGARAAMVELAPGGLSTNARRQPRRSPQGTSTDCKQASSGAGLRLSKVSSGLSSNGSPNPGGLSSKVSDG
uniref:Uncharacterized protein n=1 Tax=Oryza meridionalis TaxID=40149 RepID=A0A0E0DPZ7_9ORYZ